MIKHAALALVLACGGALLGLAPGATLAQPVAAGAPAEYRLGSGDVVRITVYRTPT
jgi:protein involved in polysaccharide export with SLBB domain